MKKKVLAALLAAAMCITMCGCGKGKNEAAGSTEQASEVVSGTEAAETVTSSVVYDGKSSAEIGIDYAANLTELGEYKGLAVTVDKAYEVNDDSMNDYMYQLMNYYGGDVTVAVTDHDTVQEGDLVSVTYTGKQLDGTVFQEAADDVIDVSANTNTSGTTYIDGFSAPMIGAKVGETVEGHVTFPENYGKEDLNGKETVFTYEIKAIVKKATFDDITDEQVSSLFATSGVDTVAALKENVKSILEYQLYGAKVEDVKSQVLEASTVTVPEDYLTARVYEYAKMYETANCGGSNLETLLSYYGYTLDNFYSEITESLREEIGYEIAFSKIAELENIQIDEEEYQDYLAYYIENSGLGLETADEIYDYYGNGDAAKGEEFMRNQFRINLAIDLAVDSSNVTYQ